MEVMWAIYMFLRSTAPYRHAVNGVEPTQTRDLAIFGTMFANLVRCLYAPPQPELFIQVIILGIEGILKGLQGLGLSSWTTEIRITVRIPTEKAPCPYSLDSR